MLDAADIGFHTREKERLEEQLKQAAEQSRLPENPTTTRELSEFLVRLRLATING